MAAIPMPEKLVELIEDAEAENEETLRKAIREYGDSCWEDGYAAGAEDAYDGAA